MGKTSMDAQRSTSEPRATRLAAKVWPDILSENLRFLTHRLQQDMDTQRAFWACRTPAELMQVQATFLTTALAQYTDYATGLCTGRPKAAKDPVKAPATDPIKQRPIGYSGRYDDVPL